MESRLYTRDGAGIDLLHGLGSDDSFSILLIEDQASVRYALTASIASLASNIKVIPAASADEGIDLFRKARPDIVLLDVNLEMAEKDGYWVAKQMRAIESGDWTPIIFLSAMDNELDVWRGIESGGDDYLVKPVRPIVLISKLRAMQRLRDMRKRLAEVSEELYQANTQLKTMVETDALTGLVNRRGFDRCLMQEIKAGRREKTPLTLILCDIDHFKRLNDSVGHHEGDECLRKIGKLLRGITQRPRDVPARYGGEEFALILPNTPRTGAMTFARAIGNMLRVYAVPHPDSPIGSHITISGGITTCIPDDRSSPEDMIQKADAALYAAKAKGRNRFFSFEMQLDTIQQRPYANAAANTNSI